MRGGRVGERRLADERVAVILRDRALTAEIAPFTPHDMRRTSISELLDAGADLATVQKMVGHERVTTTAGYDRRGDAAKRKSADLMHVPFFRGWPEQAATEVIAPAHPAENQQDRIRPPFRKENAYLVAVQNYWTASAPDRLRCLVQTAVRSYTLAHTDDEDVV